MQLENFIENADGSVTVTTFLDDREEQIFFLKGIRSFIKEENLSVKAVEPSVVNIDKKMKTWELTDEESHFFIEKGIIEALKEMVAKKELTDEHV